MIRKFKNRQLPKGILVDDGYVKIRIFLDGRMIKRSIGPVSEIGIIDSAISKLNEFRERIRLGKLDLDETSRRITIEEAIGTYWKLHAERKKSAESFELNLRRIKEVFGGRFIDSITYVDVQNYRRIREKSVSPSSVNKEQTVLTNLFNRLKEWKRLGIIKNIRLPDDNPGSLVKRVNERQYARKRVVAPEEFRRFLAVAPESVKKICLAAVNTTLRLKDLKNLTRDNVNITANKLEGVQAKTGKSYSIPMNGVMQKIVANSAGNQIFDFKNFRKLFEAARKESKIVHFQFRDLRRSGARAMLAKGMDIDTVRRILGHTTIGMTEMYVPSNDNDAQIATEVLGSLFFPAPLQTVPKTVPKRKFMAVSKQTKVAVNQ